MLKQCGEEEEDEGSQEGVDQGWQMSMMATSAQIRQRLGEAAVT